MSVEVTKAVRTVLTKNWLDMGKIRLQVAGKTVIIRGRLTKSRDDEPVNGLFLESLEQQLSNTKGVKHIRWILDNWKFDRGKWGTKQE